MEDANLYLDSTLMMSFLTAGISGVAIVTAFTGPPHSAALRTPWIVLALLAWWTFYHFSMSATRAFVENIGAAVDLFRLNLLDALSIQRPVVPTGEAQIWDETELFIARRCPHFQGVIRSHHPLARPRRIRASRRPSRYPRKLLVLPETS